MRDGLLYASGPWTVAAFVVEVEVAFVVMWLMQWESEGGFEAVVGVLMRWFHEEEMMAQWVLELAEAAWQSVGRAVVLVGGVVAVAASAAADVVVVVSSCPQVVRQPEALHMGLGALVTRILLVLEVRTLGARLVDKYLDILVEFPSWATVSSPY